MGKIRSSHKGAGARRGEGCGNGSPLPFGSETQITQISANRKTGRLGSPSGPKIQARMRCRPQSKSLRRVARTQSSVNADTVLMCEYWGLTSFRLCSNNRLHGVCRYGIHASCSLTGIPKKTISLRRHDMSVSKLSLSILRGGMFGGWLSIPTKKSIRDRDFSSSQSMITSTSSLLRSVGR